MVTKLLKLTQNVRELAIASGVAIAVALASTLAGSVFDHIHQVDAEALTAQEKTAQPGPDSTQLLSVDDWGVNLKLPLVSELPLVSYTDHGGTSIGLSSADLAKLGAECKANRNALGSILRLNAGSYMEAATRGNWRARFINTIGQYDYVYVYPQTACTEKPEAVPVVNREVSIFTEAMDSLSAK